MDLKNKSSFSLELYASLTLYVRGQTVLSKPNARAYSQSKGRQIQIAGLKIELSLQKDYVSLVD